VIDDPLSNGNQGKLPSLSQNQTALAIARRSF
jgi:hypothetical protein